MIVSFVPPPPSYSTTRHCAVCRCRVTCHCYPAWLEGRRAEPWPPSRWHRLIPGAALVPPRAKLEARHRVSVYCAASVIGFADNVIVVQEPVVPSSPIPPSPLHTASLPPSVLPADARRWKVALDQNRGTRYQEPNTFSVKHCVYI